jgi:hypothetical protein
VLPAAPLPGPIDAARAEVTQLGGPVGAGEDPAGEDRAGEDGAGPVVAEGGAVTVTVVVTAGRTGGADADPHPVRKPAAASRTTRALACRNAVRADFIFRLLRRRASYR